MVDFRAIVASKSSSTIKNTYTRHHLEWGGEGGVGGGLNLMKQFSSCKNIILKREVENFM
jgi:hypothetical protein